MSYLYDQRKRSQGPRAPEPDRSPSPGLDALMSGQVRPTAAQKGRSIDLDGAIKAKMEHAFGDLSPGEILTKPNDALCVNNQTNMFVTVWLGILEISTGRLTAANAGHEFPAVKQGDGPYEILKDKHGLLIGYMEGMRYAEYELQLAPGDRVFVYTDGVPEATSAEEELFGTDRMIEALNQDPDASPREVLENVRRAVDGFVKEAEQFDDLTMLCLEYQGPGKEP